MATMENYLKAKLEEVEKSKCAVEFELFRLKQEGTIGLAAEMEAMKDTVDAATKHVHGQDVIIADLRKQLANEKKYSSNLKSTIDSLKQAGTFKTSQMMSAKKTATTKSQAAKETIQKLQDQLDEKSRLVVHFRTEWKRAEVEIKLLRGNLETTEPAAGVKRKSGDDGGAPKKRFTRAHADDSSGDEDDEEPLKNLWQRRTAAATAGMANIKLEKED